MRTTLQTLPHTFTPRLQQTLYLMTNHTHVELAASSGESDLTAILLLTTTSTHFASYSTKATSTKPEASERDEGMLEA